MILNQYTYILAVNADGTIFIKNEERDIRWIIIPPNFPLFIFESEWFPIVGCVYYFINESNQPEVCSFINPC